MALEEYPSVPTELNQEVWFIDSFAKITLPSLISDLFFFTANAFQIKH